jgi:anaerobic selenocysteine-containing dehydrogenase
MVVMAKQEQSASRPRAQPPEESTPVEIRPISKVAGGVHAILSTVKSAWTEMGAVRGTRVLLQLNQAGGFDCPGCAWPEPDAERSHAEFCENGAKHVADEATTKRLTPEFFAKWSVVELSEQSDYWLGKQGRLTQPLVLRQSATHYEPVSWDDAFALVANELRSLGSPDEAMF